MDKKGQVGLDTAKAVMLTLLVIGMLVFATVIVLQNLADSPVASDTGSGEILMEQTSTNVTTVPTALTAEQYRDAICTVNRAINTSGTFIDSLNYTVAGCSISFVLTGGDLLFNDTAYILNYTYTYNSFFDVSANISVGTSDFFANTSTWIALLAVVVIILIIAIVIFAVNRFGGGRTAGL